MNSKIVTICGEKWTKLPSVTRPRKYFYNSLNNEFSLVESYYIDNQWRFEYKDKFRSELFNSLENAAKAAIEYREAL